MGGWASIVRSFFSDPFFSEGALSTFIHLGPFTLESRIHVKALKMQGFWTNYALINPYQKHSTETIFQGGTPWVTQILNNVIVWMLPYCAQQLLGHFFGI